MLRERWSDVIPKIVFPFVVLVGVVVTACEVAEPAQVDRVPTPEVDEILAPENEEPSSVVPDAVVTPEPEPVPKPAPEPEPTATPEPATGDAADAVPDVTVTDSYTGFSLEPGRYTATTTGADSFLQGEDGDWCYLWIVDATGLHVAQVRPSEAVGTHTLGFSVSDYDGPGPFYVDESGCGGPFTAAIRAAPEPTATPEPATGDAADAVPDVTVTDSYTGFSLEPGRYTATTTGADSFLQGEDGDWCYLWIVDATGLHVAQVRPSEAVGTHTLGFSVSDYDGPGPFYVDESGCGGPFTAAIRAAR